MNKGILAGLAAVLIAFAAFPGPVQAQLFNSEDGNKGGGAANTATAPKAGGNQNPLFNSPGKNDSNGAKPLFLDKSMSKSNSAAKPFSPERRTTTARGNNGFTRPPGSGDLSAQDMAIREAAMRRLALANEASARVEADTLRRMQMPDQYNLPDGSREDRSFGSMLPEDIEGGGELVYDKHRPQRDPDAPPRLFNTTR